ncbi:hypothetical protein ACTPT9_004814 [Serratia marcescens]|uniref:hypothetical protein n=1 Tax=Serratia marcescens TaxID=615 RepID=UPI002791CD5F|nr:hypothetical protein [Serratia marcescens]ELD1859442.1 hypothetical protein [Serratia marcescens]ELM0006310.1 hypothetical protein [Serratia marcescens]MDP8028878.1 hypothetical protein [Serratia marcescens]HBH7559393.1 hypothetical protein [Serratia marcescens]HEJ0022849.1 hypothetical protein [Serratia marcescens]
MMVLPFTRRVGDLTFTKPYASEECKLFAQVLLHGYDALMNGYLASSATVIRSLFERTLPLGSTLFLRIM